MTRTLTQFIDPITACGLIARSLGRSAIRAARHHLARADETAYRERKGFVIRQDLAHLDLSQLRDIGLDRDAL